MDITALAMSRVGPSLGMAIARLLPYSMACAVARRLARRAAKDPRSPLLQAILANQAVVRGLPHDDPRLEQAAIQVLENAALGYVDLFKAMAKGPEGILEHCKMHPDMQERLDAGMAEGRGLLIIGPHTLGFDFFLLWLGVMGYPVQALSYADPRGSYLTQNMMRARFGLRVTPVSVPALREAYRNLRRGRAVLTGVDRAGLGGVRLRFFGREVVLPDGPARMACRTGAPVLVGLPHRVAPGYYQADLGGWFEPPQSGDLRKNTLELAQALLGTLERFIAQHPDQWLMFHPVWGPNP
jgi:KDO2-lipid IV(A) lauroyltransferase